MPEVIIIGTGFSGLGMAIQLKRQGRDDFVLLEKADDIGGTWRDNSYPGCACDVPSHMYSYSFEPKADWSRAYSRQPEIWDYLKELTEKYSLREHIRFGEEVTSAKWSGNEWAVGTAKGEYRGQFLVAGVGALHIPNIPELPGIERFEGHTFHSANWDHGYDLHGKRVLGSNKYYRALTSDNVDVVTEGIQEVRERSIVTRDGVEREVDAVIYATGFHVTDSFAYLDIKGRDGVDLAARWRDEGIQTHLWITVNGFPNAFFLLGPNTGLGHNSVVFMIEAQIRYALAAMKMVRRSRAEAFEVRPSVQAAFNDEIQRKLASGVWSTGGYTSWYLDSHGVNRTIWPGFTWQYWLRTRKVDTGDFELTGSRARKLTGVA